MTFTNRSQDAKLKVRVYFHPVKQMWLCESCCPFMMMIIFLQIKTILPYRNFKYKTQKFSDGVVFYRHSWN